MRRFVKRHVRRARELLTGVPPVLTGGERRGAAIGCVAASVELPPAFAHLHTAMRGRAELRAIFAPHCQLAELRAMTEHPDDAPVFGKRFIQVALMRRPT